eukprot:TRINITY_DN932_c0_g1_i1.p1 TRINITY_DN932_c0_g1~~TRINITY_DN932_c0_g1_i1.p1  ORF type:complete len:612 (-),score=157.10 TRINITY_DN932_c0_g1_i1:71-1696(-)
MRQYSRLPGRQTVESKYWKSFSNQVLVSYTKPCPIISFTKKEPFDYAIPNGTRIDIYDVNTNTVKKKLSRFSEVVHACDFRKDSKLVVAGGADKLVQVFTLQNRSILRTFKGHTATVTTTKFSNYDITKIISGSEDKTIKILDIPTEKTIISIKGHKDFIKGIEEIDDNIYLSASYDGTIKLWDIRTDVSEASGSTSLTFSQPSSEIIHGEPIEVLQSFKNNPIDNNSNSNNNNNNTMFATAAGDHFKVWDLLKGEELFHVSNHQKLITSLGIDETGTRFFSGSIDQHVKIYDVENYKVLHSIKYPAPIMSIGVSPGSTHVVVGMSDGTLSIKNRKNNGNDEQDLFNSKNYYMNPLPGSVFQLPSLQEFFTPKKKTIRAGTYKFFTRGKNVKVSDYDYKVEVSKKVKLNIYEKFLKKYQYRDALDSVLETNNPIIIMSLIDELYQRNAVQIAISKRSSNELIPLLNFIVTYITHPRYTSTLIPLSHLILDTYSVILGQSNEIDLLFFKIQQKLHQEIKLQKNMFSLLGYLEMLDIATNTDV